MTELCCLQRSEKYGACTDEEGGFNFRGMRVYDDGEILQGAMTSG